MACFTVVFIALFKICLLYWRVIAVLATCSLSYYYIIIILYYYFIILYNTSWLKQ